MARMDKGAAKIAAAAACAFLLGAALRLLPGAIDMAMEQPAVQGQPEPVIEMTAFYGPFDDIALFRYYKITDMPDSPELPAEPVDYDGRTHRPESVDGPVDTRYGACWEVLYMEVEK